MAIDIAALKSEIQNDPDGLGYAGFAGSNAQIRGLLNAPSTSYPQPAGVIEAYKVVGAIVPADWGGLSAGERERISFIVGAGNVNVDDTNVRNAFATAFGAGSTTRTNLVALQNRAGSRAEDLFGAGTNIRREDVQAAREAP